MTKEQYLNYIMLTQPMERWSSTVYRYAVKSGVCQPWKEGFDFIIKWSSYGGISASIISYYMAIEGIAKVEWTMAVIEEEIFNDSEFDQNVEWAAKNLHIYMGAAKEWLEKILYKEKQMNV